MATKRAKSSSQNHNSSLAVDRISRLADPVIHRILSLIPTIDADRMSLLSKRWRRMWYSVPSQILIFRASPFMFSKHSTIEKFILKKCIGLLNPRISSSSLKALRIANAASGFDTIQVEATNVKVFRIFR
ncbi:Putative F-box/FBD/LRR-repeat protein [Morus notabilis]|uniref:Putative F-box/FBD/LRR-repeat protein n=1 Tax=Morus notabilis TaxID=981085 RepID=W9R473_9ROSA|nr:Putative F-box/FBD/LRR-repeat protein [Morus notabilis]